MAIGSSTSPRRQSGSQGRGQMRPRMPGNGRSSRTMAAARGKVAVVDLLDEGGDVDVRRAGRPSRAPRSRRCGRRGTCAGSWRAWRARARCPVCTTRPSVDPGGAGGLQLAPALDLDEAEAAGAPGGHALFVAERRDLDAGALRGLQHRLAALVAADERAVDGRASRGSWSWGLIIDLPPATWPERRCSTSMASNLQTWRQVSHLMQCFWPIFCSCLRSPLTACVGQAV